MNYDHEHGYFLTDTSETYESSSYFYEQYLSPPRKNQVDPILWNAAPTDTISPQPRCIANTELDNWEFLEFLKEIDTQEDHPNVSITSIIKTSERVATPRTPRPEVPPQKEIQLTTTATQYEVQPPTLPLDHTLDTNFYYNIKTFQAPPSTSHAFTTPNTLLCSPPINCSTDGPYIQYKIDSEFYDASIEEKRELQKQKFSQRISDILSTELDKFVKQLRKIDRIKNQRKRVSS